MPLLFLDIIKKKPSSIKKHLTTYYENEILATKQELIKLVGQHVRFSACTDGVCTPDRKRYISIVLKTKDDEYDLG